MPVADAIAFATLDKSTQNRIASGSGRSGAITPRGRTVRLIDYFDASAQRYPSKTAFIQPDGARLTYAAVEQQSRRIASALHASGVAETGKVAVYGPNDARAFIAMLAIWPDLGAAQRAKYGGR